MSELSELSDAAVTNEIEGALTFPDVWTIVTSDSPAIEALPAARLKSIPSELTINGESIEAQRVTATRNQYDFKPQFGAPPYTTPHEAYVFVPLDSDSDQRVTLGMGADFYMQAWVNGALVLDTMSEGNGPSPPSIDDHHVPVSLAAGRNVLAVRFMHGKGSAIVALGGPAELRSGPLASIAPELAARGAITTADELYKHFPPDPEAPIRWQPPAGFAPSEPGLGLTKLEAAEHTELLHAIPSNAPIDDGGSGAHESIAHGTWNHGARICVYGHWVAVSWQQHAVDEGGPGTRVIGRIGRVINEQGEVDWGDERNLIEPGPPPVPVRRRQRESERDVIRSAQTRGHFVLIDGKLFFAGYFAAKHGVASDRRYGLNAGERPADQPIPSEHYHFAQGPLTIGGANVQWDLGYRFYQQWDERDGRLQPVTPMYKEKDFPDELAVTPDLTMPLEPLQPPYTQAVHLDDAPAEVQQAIRHGKREDLDRELKFQPGTSLLAADGINGVVLTHSSEFQRPDGAWIAIRENQGPPRQQTYYAAQKSTADACYPPARRTNLIGGVKPVAGELPDGRAYIVCNSTNRQNMYLTVSRDGYLFDRTWLLRHVRLPSYTPGMMKGQGGPGSGPQYFKSAIVGQSLWIVYSISKEHVAATRVPIAAL